MGRSNNKHENIKTYLSALIVLIIGISMIVLMKYKENGETINLIERRNKEEKVSLVASSKYGQSELEMDILPYKISEKELLELLDRFKEDIRKEIIGGNSSFDNITQNLNFVGEIDGYPFEVEYKVEPREIISKSGEILGFEGDEATAKIRMIYTYEDYMFEDEVMIHLSKNVKSEEERFEEKLLEYLVNENESSRYSETIDLPTVIDGETVEWTEKKSSKIPAILLLMVIGVIYIFSREKIRLSEEKKIRQEEIKRDYPAFACKYSLLSETGLPHRQIMEKMFIDYSKDGRNNAIASELKITINEMRSGVSQIDALNHMALRCHLREMTQFVSLISQNIKKGGDTIAEQIKLAAMESVEMEKEELRKKAEKAGTKLLLPMFIMLILVFAMIMIPAFNSFSF